MKAEGIRWQSNLSPWMALFPLAISASAVLVVAAAAETAGNPELPSPPQIITSGQETISLLSAIFKAVGALALVVGIMLLLLFLIKKIGLSRNRFRPNALIKILEIQSLTPKKHVAVLEVASEFIVVGITEQQINLLTKLDKNSGFAESLTAEKKSVPQLPSFAQIFGKTLDKFKNDTSRSK
jgi:flagellar protein FliO/FliZ